MDSVAPPLVSVITPVYNGEAYLEDCIESVLSQTWQRWEYVIVDNASTDRTGEIAELYASKDDRIRVVHNDRLLPIIPNWNLTMRQISSDSVYTKVVHGDDLLFRNCIEKMVDLAEDHPEAGIVGAYRLDGNVPRPSPGLPHTERVFRGVDVARETLRQSYSVFGSPSSLLIRSALVRERPDFYDARYLHADKAVCMELLKRCDFGFVPQILTYTRIHGDSQSTVTADRLGTRLLENLLMLREFGPSLLTVEELRERISRQERRHYRFLARRLLRPEVRRHHRERMAAHGLGFDAWKLAVACVYEGISRLLPRDLDRLANGTD
jgi:glycosyltransferase involved in cell wall biosynthesis